MQGSLTSVRIDGASLTGADVASVARPNGQSLSGESGAFAKAALDSDARARVENSRRYIEQEWMNDSAPMMYGFNTGVGLFKDTRVTIEDMEAYQFAMIRAHATGVGEPFAEDVVRATLLLRANAFASNYSGLSVNVIDRLLDFLNAGIHPIMPQKGSVGASGDLAPLAHVSGALLGWPEAPVIYRGQRMPSAEAIKLAGLSLEFPLGAKDASALINGSTVSLALSTLALHDAKRILKTADIALALTLEAMRAETTGFDPRIQQARPHSGQIRVASNIRRLLAGSQRTTHEARQIVFPEENRDPAKPLPPRIQDVYSLRCAPQVHGPVMDALDYIDRIVSVEINSATDNPLMFAKEGGGAEVLSGGNFHGQYLAQAADLLAIVMTDLGSISERRLARLIDPNMSFGLPRNLNGGKRGLNTGFPTVQCSMSALVMESRTLSSPGSVDSIPGKGNSEDHVSNSTWCGHKARAIVENADRIVATELLMAAQALSLVDPITRDYPIAPATKAVLEAIRSVAPAAMDGDRWWASDMDAVLRLAQQGGVIAAAESAIGVLD